ncbi:MAG TPA: RHS repeat-associated core domain-containing protein, partial [Herpetosiphonaceae bacterium]
RRTLVTAAGTTTYAYDSANRLSSVTDPASGTIGYTYDAAGNRTRLSYPNGVIADYTYDQRNRLIGIVQHKGASAPIASYTYTLDPTGNRTRVTELGNTAIEWTYNQAQQLIGESTRNSSGTIVSQTGYTYDGVGNRLSETINGQTRTYSYNTLDQIVAAGTTQYRYDARGNLIEQTDGSRVTSYSYDAADRLVSTSLPGGTSIGYGYDADGRRVRQTSGSTTTNYLWDDSSQYGDVVLETDGSGGIQASYVLGGAELLSQTRSGTTSYYHTDGQGSVRTLTDSAGNVTDRYSYSAYGTLSARQGTTVNPYQYTGQQTDPQTGLTYHRARYYSPADGRFLSRDTAAVDRQNPEELNRYGYVHGDPINYADPSGLFQGPPPAPPAPAPTKTPVRGAGGPAGEYAMLVGIILGLMPILIQIAEAINCIFFRITSILMAAAKDKYGLLALERIAPKRCIIPILKVPRGAMPETAQHIQDAQDGPWPMLLSYGGPGSSGPNRRAACSPARKAQLRPLTCDEYPFASTQQGGAGASTRGVPGSETSPQGGLLSGFYSSNGMKAGDLFAVIVIP